MGRAIPHWRLMNGQSARIAQHAKGLPLIRFRAVRNAESLRKLDHFAECAIDPYRSALAIFCHSDSCRTQIDEGLKLLQPLSEDMIEMADIFLGLPSFRDIDKC